jgi:hypothetical protein
MKAMILGMCILSHKTQCFLMFGHVVGVGTGKSEQQCQPLQGDVYYQEGFFNMAGNQSHLVAVVIL